MRIILIGANGTIGREVAKTLQIGHEVVTASRSNATLKVDIAEPESIEAMFLQSGPFDAVVCAAGAAKFAPLAELTADDFLFSCKNKLLGQVNLVRIGERFINANGSFTLTSGVLASEPIPGSTAISMVNAGLEGFVRAAQLELKEGLRLNIVSPIWVAETLQALGRDPAGGMPAAQVARAYLASVNGAMQGKVLDVRNYL